VVVNCAFREDQPLGDLAVGEALRHEAEHLDLARGEAGRVRTSRRPRAAPQAADATLPEAPSNDRYGRLSSEATKTFERFSKCLVVISGSERERCIVG